MRTPNTKCCICEKPIYRRPFELKKVRYVACYEHREQAKRQHSLTKAQKEALAMGRQKGTNHLEGIPKSEESKRKASESHKEWCAANPDKVKARGKKTRGKNHYNWKGGCSRLNAAIRRLTENRKWMDAVVRRDKVCMECGSETDLEAHHIQPLVELIDKNGIKNTQQARDSNELWNTANGKTLCEKCHCKLHGRKHSPTGQGKRKLPKKERPSVVGKNNPNYRGGKITIICPQCGNEFAVKQSEASKRKYCSRRCANESHRKHI